MYIYDLYLLGDFFDYVIFLLIHGDFISSELYFVKYQHSYFSFIF